MKLLPGCVCSILRPMWFAWLAHLDTARLGLHTLRVVARTTAGGRKYSFWACHSCMWGARVLAVGNDEAFQSGIAIMRAYKVAAAVPTSRRFSCTIFLVPFFFFRLENAYPSGASGILQRQVSTSTTQHQTDIKQGVLSGQRSSAQAAPRTR